MKAVGIEQVHGRRLFLARIGEEWQWDDPGEDRFILFIAADASAASDLEIEGYAFGALASGCEYVCAWGDDCERVHDLFDRVAAERVQELPPVGLISTWHAADTLPEAMYFALVLAHNDEPEDKRPINVSSPVVLAAQEKFVAEVRALVADQAELARLLIGDE